MKKMTPILTIIIGFSLTWSSCEKIDVPKGTPKCITRKIKKEKDNCLDKVYEYNYNGELVYLFTPPINTCFDAWFSLYNEDCKLICRPAGGMTGLGDGQCPNFYQDAINQKLIWTK